MSSLPSAWLLAGAVAVGWLGGGVSAWVFLRAGRKAPRAREEGVRPGEPAAVPFAANPVVLLPEPAPTPERRLLELSDEEIDALAAELPAAEHAQRRKLPAPRKPVLRNI